MEKKPKPLKIRKSQRKQTYKSLKHKEERNIESIVKKRYYVLIIVVVIAITILLLDLFYVQMVQNKYYTQKVKELSTKIIEGSSVPRGRIYDRNHKLLVDNVPVKTIYYKKPAGMSQKEEIELSYALSDILELDISSLKESDLRTFWMKSHVTEAKNKITEKEWKNLEERKITNEQIETLQKERITIEELEALNEKDE